MGNWYQNGEFMAELPFSFQGLLPACEMSTPLKFHSSTHENYRPKPKREASSSSQFLFRGELLNFGPSVLVEYDLPKDVWYFCVGMSIGMALVPSPYLSSNYQLITRCWYLSWSIISLANTPFSPVTFILKTTPPPTKKKNEKVVTKNSIPHVSNAPAPAPAAPGGPNSVGAPF